MPCWMPACAGMTPGRPGLIANCSGSTPWGWRTSRLQGAIEGPEPEMRAASPRKVRAKQLTARPTAPPVMADHEGLPISTRMRKARIGRGLRSELKGGIARPGICATALNRAVGSHALLGISAGRSCRKPICSAIVLSSFGNSGEPHAKRSTYRPSGRRFPIPGPRPLLAEQRREESGQARRLLAGPSDAMRLGQMGPRAVSRNYYLMNGLAERWTDRVAAIRPSGQGVVRC